MTGWVKLGGHKLIARGGYNRVCEVGVHKLIVGAGYDRVCVVGLPQVDCRSWM